MISALCAMLALVEGLACVPAGVARAPAVVLPVTEYDVGSCPPTPVATPVATPLEREERGLFLPWVPAGDVTRGFGPGHGFVEVAGPGPARAVAGGRVTWAGFNAWGWGYLVVLEHAGGWQSWYGRLAFGSVRVRCGERVPAGARLGLGGEEGWVLALRLGEVAYDPEGWKDGERVSP